MCLSVYMRIDRFVTIGGGADVVDCLSGGVCTSRYSIPYGVSETCVCVCLY